jgi:hypothetical protein
MIRCILCALFLVLPGCVRYSFTGSTLPAHIKSASIPLVENVSAQIGLEERLREAVYSSFSSINILRLTDNAPDAELRLKILSYANLPDEYDVAGNVKTYKVVIDVGVVFMDLRENEALYEGTARGVGVYDHTSENEETGLQNALKMINDFIINNTISGW